MKVGLTMRPTRLTMMRNSHKSARNTTAIGTINTVEATMVEATMNAAEATMNAAAAGLSHHLVSICICDQLATIMSALNLIVKAIGSSEVCLF